ncbi:N-acetylmuramoyl-L-alanine amidase family protein, partial [Helcococcus ovis]
MKNSWSKVGESWYYLNENGEKVTGWEKVSGKWYYLKSTGEMATGW